jgi:hypothetical protein
MTKSTGGASGSSARRQSSRSRRFSRFRSTAECACFGMTSPIRACGRREREATTRTSKCSVRSRFPSRAIFRRSAPRVMRRPGSNVSWLRAGVLTRKLYRQALAAFLAATSQDLTSPLVCHASTKAVCLHTALVTGAVGWLAHAMPLEVSGTVQTCKAIPLR